MLFPTTVFAVFFAIVFLGARALRRHTLHWQWFMLVASYVFYGWWDWRFLGLIGFCTVVNHLAACLMARTQSPVYRKWLIGGVIVIDLGVLGFFKYYGFFVQSALALFGTLGWIPPLPLIQIVLPVGISFFTFQAMSYVIDVYRKEIPPAQSLLAFGTYLAFFPQLVAGPIVRASLFLPQLAARPDESQPDTGRALVLILVGLFKKTVLANMLAQYVVDPVFAFPTAYGGGDILLSVYGYALQIYCDFSAYSDIAIGVALLLGIRFPDNFNAPYFATSFRGFWRRWHISLSTWLRDYLYIPLGGSRQGGRKTARNLMITFLLGGLWHGAHWRFVMWGALHGFYLIMERQLGRLTGGGFPAGVRWLRPLVAILGGFVVFHGVCFSWIFFRAETFGDGIMMIKRLGDWGSAFSLWQLPLLIVLAAGFAIQFFDGGRLAPLHRWMNARPVWVQSALASIVLTIILGLGPQGVAPFIYFQF